MPLEAVSYTHLDVYKRQVLHAAGADQYNVLHTIAGHIRKADARIGKAEIGKGFVGGTHFVKAFFGIVIKTFKFRTIAQHICNAVAVQVNELHLRISKAERGQLLIRPETITVPHLSLIHI